MHHPLSLAALTVLEIAPHEMIEVAAAAGFPFVGLRLVPATLDEPHTPVVGNEAELKRILAALEQTGVKVLDVEILRLKPDTDVRDYLPVLEVGARVGATEILVAGNDDNEARTIENFARLCELAAPLGMYPHLEFMPWTGVKNLGQAARIVSAAAQDNAGLLVDAFHLNRSRSRVSDIATLPKQWFRYAQLCDIAGAPPANMDEVIREARCERCFPGEGDIDLAELLELLPDLIPLSLEIPTQKLAESGVTPLQRAVRARESAESLLGRLAAKL